MYGRRFLCHFILNLKNKVMISRIASEESDIIIYRFLFIITISTAQLCTPVLYNRLLNTQTTDYLHMFNNMRGQGRIQGGAVRGAPPPR